MSELREFCKLGWPVYLGGLIGLALVPVVVPAIDPSAAGAAAIGGGLANGGMALGLLIAWRWNR